MDSTNNAKCNELEKRLLRMGQIRRTYVFAPMNAEEVKAQEMALRNISHAFNVLLREQEIAGLHSPEIAAAKSHMAAAIAEAVRHLHMYHSANNERKAQ